MITIMLPLRRHRDRAFLPGRAMLPYLFQGVPFRLVIHAGPDIYDPAEFTKPLDPAAAKVQIITEKRAAMLPFCEGHAHFADDNLILPNKPILRQMLQLLNVEGVGVVAGLYHSEHFACGCLMLEAQLRPLITPLVAYGCECNYITERVSEAGFSLVGIANGGFKHEGGVSPALSDRAQFPEVSLKRNELAPGISEVSAVELQKLCAEYGANWVSEFR